MLHQVGVGTLGPVFRTYEPTRDRLVAVKVFRLDITPEQAQALADELSKPADAGLFHPSIVEPIAAGVEGTSAYRADEYVAAETLDVAMRHYAPAPLEKVLPFITQLAGAVDFARSVGVGHGALHPRDVFVTPEEARAGGFGVVEALERVGLRAPVRRPYTAPERVAGGQWGAPADVFSLAVITYELMTGRRPSGTGPQIAPISGGAEAAAVHAVIVRAMSEDPARRYSTALAFASALDAASTGTATAASAGIAAAPSADIDDQARQMPAAAAIDERSEPAEAEIEEAQFRASEPDFDDVAAERDEDEAHAALEFDEEPDLHAPLRLGHDRSLFDDEAVQDLSIEPALRNDTERFADEFVASEPFAEETERPAAPPPRRAPLQHQEPVRAPSFTPAVSLGGYADESVVRDQRGIGIVPVVVTVVLALLVGFAAGYSVAGRTPAAVAPADTVSSVPPANPPPQAQPQQPAPKPYSEQAVSPPAEPPVPSGEVPAPGAGTAAASNEPAATKPAPPPKPTTGSVEVRSTPSGAGVTVDGRWRGRTPLTVPDLRFGSHRVRVVQPGYAAGQEDVALSSSTPTRALSFRLQRSAAAPTPQPAARSAQRPSSRNPAAAESYAGSIYVDSRPRGARVLVDGKFLGTTPVRIPDIPIGSHVVRLQLADHRDWTTSTRVTASQESRVTGSLERIK